jgi:hypothetical protein
MVRVTPHYINPRRCRSGDFYVDSEGLGWPLGDSAFIAGVTVTRHLYAARRGAPMAIVLQVLKINIT